MKVNAIGRVIPITAARLSNRMRRALGVGMVGVLGFGIALPALADSPVTLKSVAEVEQLVKQPDGTFIKKRQLLKSAPPGQEVIFTNTITNISKLPAERLVLSNAISKNMRLTHVFGDARVEYSVDGGKVFAMPEQLKVKDENGVLRLAKMDDYSDIRWTLALLKPNTAASVGYNAVIR